MVCQFTDIPWLAIQKIAHLHCSATRRASLLIQNLQSRLGNGNIRNSWASCWLPDSYPSLVSWLLCTRVREWGYLVYTHAGCLAENLQESVLCPTLIMIYVTFQALVKMWWSYRRMLLNLKHKTLYCAPQTELPFACVTLLSTNYLYTIRPLSHDIWVWKMQCNTGIFYQPVNDFTFLMK